MRKYPTIQLDTNVSKETAYCMKIDGCKWTWENIRLYK
jgi:hypothetical protein